LNELGYELESKLFAGENVNNYTPCHYFSTKIIDILDIYIQTLDLVGPQLDTGYIEEFKSPITFGSQQVPISHSSSLFYQLDHQVRNNPNPFQTLNHYSIWLWHICMLTTSARPSESFPPNLDYIDLDNQLMAVADKEQRYSGTIGRYLPFNNFLRDEIQHYLKYLKHFLHLTKAYLSQEQVQAIQEVFDGERLLLLFYDSKGYVRNLELSDIQKYCTEIALQRNWTRHFARYFFAQYCNEDLIKASLVMMKLCRNCLTAIQVFRQQITIKLEQHKTSWSKKLKSMSTFNGFLIE
jgi:hypothetical protein